MVLSALSTFRYSVFFNKEISINLFSINSGRYIFLYPSNICPAKTSVINPLGNVSKPAAYGGPGIALGQLTIKMTAQWLSLPKY